MVYFLTPTVSFVDLRAYGNYWKRLGKGLGFMFKKRGNIGKG
jgi:hypothetical protein